MNIDDIEALIRKYLSAGIAVIVILVAPGTGAGEENPAGDDPSVVTVEPDRPARPEVPPPDGTDELADYEPPRALPRDQGDVGEPFESVPVEDGTATPDRPAEDTDPDLDVRGPAGGSEPGVDETGVDEGTTAAAEFGWGTPDREDDFTTGSAEWDVYDGPGHAGNGVRSPDALTIEDGEVLVITGDPAGTTGGLSWGGGQQYGRWEGRVRAPASDPSYNALLLLWPDAENFPVGGEIDFMEMLDPTRQTTDFFLHHGEANEQVNGQVEIDGTQWHNWAVEWTPDAITAFVDGEQWFRTTDTSTFPPGPMHLTIQLDWFPEGSAQVQESRMEVDWVRQWSLDATPPEDAPPHVAQPG